MKLMKMWLEVLTIIPGVKLLDARRINVYDILNSDKLIMTEAAIKSVEEVLG